MLYLVVLTCVTYFGNTQIKVLKYICYVSILCLVEWGKIKVLTLPRGGGGGNIKIKNSIIFVSQMSFKEQ